MRDLLSLLLPLLSSTSIIVFMFIFSCSCCSAKPDNLPPCTLKDGDCTWEIIFSHKSTPRFIFDEQNRTISQTHNYPSTQRAKTYCYNDRYELIYFMIPKSGSTTMSTYMVKQLNGGMGTCSRMWGWEQFEVEANRYKNYLKVTIARDPIKHFLSGYGEAGVYNQYQEDKVTKYQDLVNLHSVDYARGRGNFDPGREKVDNRISVNYLIMTFEQRKKFMYKFVQDSLTGEYCNRHCMPQSNWIFAWDSKGNIIQLPDFIAKLETLDESWNQMNAMYQNGHHHKKELPVPSKQLNVAHQETAGLGSILWKAEWNETQQPISFCTEGGSYDECEKRVLDFAEQAKRHCNKRNRACIHQADRLRKDMAKELMSADAAFIMKQDTDGHLTKMVCAYVFADYFALKYPIPNVCNDEQVLEEFFYYRNMRDRKTAGRSP